MAIDLSARERAALVRLIKLAVDKPKRARIRRKETKALLAKVKGWGKRVTVDTVRAHGKRVSQQRVARGNGERGVRLRAV